MLSECDDVCEVSSCDLKADKAVTLETDLVDNHGERAWVLYMIHCISHGMCNNVPLLPLCLHAAKKKQCHFDFLFSMQPKHKEKIKRWLKSNDPWHVVKCRESWSFETYHSKVHIQSSWIELSDRDNSTPKTCKRSDIPKQEAQAMPKIKRLNCFLCYIWPPQIHVVYCYHGCWILIFINVLRIVKNFSVLHNQLFCWVSQISWNYTRNWIHLSSSHKSTKLTNWIGAPSTLSFGFKWTSWSSK